MHITRFLPTLLTWSRVDIVSSCQESPETNWEDDFLLLSVFPLRIYATEPTDCKAVSLRFSMVGTNPYPQPCSAFLAFDVSVQGKAHPERKNEHQAVYVGDSWRLHVWATVGCECGRVRETRPELRVHRARTINTITRITTIVPAKP